MMKLRVNNGLLALLCMVFAIPVNAQYYKYEIELDPVKTTGFYSIPVSPEMSAHMQIDFSDVRIWDKKEKQVPYIIRTRKPKWQSRLFKPYSVLANTLDDSGRSVIIIQKKADSGIASLSLIIRNASVSRYASFSGSTDGKSWYIISEKILVNDSYETMADSSIQSISFPPSNYPFFRLVIGNRKSDPLNIVSIGHYADSQPGTPASSGVVNAEIQGVQTDSSNGISYLKLVQPEAYPVSQLGIRIDGPKYFSRRFSVLVSVSDKHRRNSLEELASFTVSSQKNFETAVPAFKSKTFYLAVENGDNPPLKIESVTTFQQYHEIVTWLEAGKDYKMVMEAAGTTAPHYDLLQFADSILGTVPEATLQKLQPRQATTADSTTDQFPKKYIWLIMIGMVALLSLLTWKLTTEMRKSKDTPD
jgi:hypothetical protein